MPGPKGFGVYEPIPLPVEECSGWPSYEIKGKALVHIRALVFDQRRGGAVTPSNWMRWEYPHQVIDLCR